MKQDVVAWVLNRIQEWSEKSVFFHTAIFERARNSGLNKNSVSEQIFCSCASSSSKFFSKV